MIAYASEVLAETPRREQKMDPELKGMRSILLDDRSRLIAQQEAELEALLAQVTTKRTARAYREQLREILQRKQHNVLQGLPLQWCTNVTRSKVEPMKEVAQLIRNRLEGIVSWVQTRLANGFLEAINTKLKRGSREMRVLSVALAPPTFFAGGKKSWLRLAPHLREQGIIVDLLYQDADGRIILERQEGARRLIWEPFGMRRGSYIGTILTVVKAIWLNRHEYGWTIFIGAPDSLFAVLGVKPFIGLKVSYRMTMLDEDDPFAIRNTGRMGWLRARLLRRIDAAICINPAMEISSRRVGIAQHRVFTILQGTDTKLFAPGTLAAKNAVRDREGVPLTAKVVMYCGAIVERKGVDLLMRAWPEVVANHPSAILLLVGPHGHDFDDPETAFFQAMMEASLQPEYGQSVKFLGYREEVQDLLVAADVFVLPSRREGTPNVLLEAMASGLPIVVSDLTGVSGVFVRNGSEAFVVPQNDWVQLGVCLRRLLEDKELAREFARRARDRALQNYSLEHVASQYAKVFRGLQK